MNDATANTGTPKAILLATDLSSRCDRALDRAALLARDWGAKLVVLHVLPAEGEARDDSPQGAEPAQSAAERSEAALAKVRRDLQLDLPEVEVIVESGDVAERIEAVAQATGAGLVVTGVARDEPFGRSFAGSTVKRLGRRSSLPVLVVRTRARTYNEILVATDFSDSSRQALTATAALFPDATLTLMHAYEVPFAGLIGRDALTKRLGGLESEAFERFLSDMPAEQRQRVRPVVEHGKPDRAIWSYMRKHGVDLVAIGSHGRSAMFDRFIGSVAAEVLENAPGDVLLVRDSRASSR